jgi:hypothetical protein
MVLFDGKYNNYYLFVYCLFVFFNERVFVRN